MTHVVSYSGGAGSWCAAKRVADQYGVGPCGVQRAVGLIDKIVGVKARTAAKIQRLVEMHRLGRNRSDRIRTRCLHGLKC